MLATREELYNQLANLNYQISFLVRLSINYEKVSQYPSKDEKILIDIFDKSTEEQRKEKIISLKQEVNNLTKILYKK